MALPTIPEAQAAYDRMLALQGINGDDTIVIDAVGVGGMPAEIVAFGTAVSDAKTSMATYMNDQTPANLAAWEASVESVRTLVAPMLT